MHSPVDLPGSTLIGGRPLLWTTVTIAVAALMLLATNGFTLAAWAAEQTPSATMARVVAAADGWQAATDRIGLGATRAWAHRLWKRAQAARFPGQGEDARPAA